MNLKTIIYLKKYLLILMNVSKSKSLALIAIEDANIAIDWKKARKIHRFNSLQTNINNIRRLISSSKPNMPLIVQELTELFNEANEYDLYDKRCIYPGCGEAINKLVKMY